MAGAGGRRRSLSRNGTGIKDTQPGRPGLEPDERCKKCKDTVEYVGRTVVEVVGRTDAKRINGFSD